jgi:hypothetical protein
MTDPYDHMREAFHIVADGLMEWEDPNGYEQTGSVLGYKRSESRSDAIGAHYRASDAVALERIADQLTRDGHIREAVELWALALKIREGLR